MSQLTQTNSVSQLKESLEQFSAPVYARTMRSAETYRSVSSHCRKHLARLVGEYRAVQNDQQQLRELRNDIDYYLRRYHAYCIKERLGVHAHYHEVGVEDRFDFEHLIPAARVRDLLLAETITIDQAINAPTVRLSRDKHEQLKDAGWASTTPNMWLPFERYLQVFDAQFQTYDGTLVDPTSWTLENHYNYFAHLIEN